MIKFKQLFMLAICCLTATSLFAQKGARISGNVFSDAEGPLYSVQITERDETDRIIEYTITDFDGNFSMVVKNTKNKLQFTAIGYKTQTLEIGSRTIFNVKMIDDNIMDEVVIVAKARSRSGDLDILDREISTATQKFNMSEMSGLSFASVDEALQGQIAGLDVVFSSGDLGSGTQMRLRGSTNLGGNNEPLIVVNDQIWEIPSGSEGTIDYNNIEADKFSELLTVNPEDIESIEVLKDAASCAIWGSRGANGVIKIKTKRGFRGPTQVNFSVKFKDKWLANDFNLLNGDEYSMLIKEAHFNPQQDPNASSIPELEYRGDAWPESQNFDNNTDWVDAIVQHGYRSEYNLNLTGGGEKATFRIAGGFSNETGTIIKQKLQQYSSRLALDYYISERIKVMADFSFSYTNNKHNYEDLLAVSQKIMPNMSIYAQDKEGNNTDDYYRMLLDGSITSSTFNDNQRNFMNPVAVANLARKEDESYTISPNITLEYNLLGLEDKQTQLKYRGLVFMNATTYSMNKYLPGSLTGNVWTQSGFNRSDVQDTKSLQFTTSHTLIFTPYLGNDNHYLTMSGKFEINTNNGNGQSQWAYGLPNNFDTTIIGAKLGDASTSKWESRSVNFTYQAHYSYLSKYSFGLAVRGEGHTQFGDDNKWTVYPSISGRWNISDESWMQWAKPVLSMLSIRPSYGWSGNVPGENGLMYSLYSPSGSYLGIAGFVSGGIRLTNLEPSQKREFNLGSDFGFFDDLISGSFNYYKNTTKKQLMSNYGLPTSTGFDKLRYRNTGSVENSGWEFNVNVNRIKVFKDFHFSMYFNVGQNFNEILEMEQTILDGRNPDFTYENAKYLQRIQVGNPLGSIYGFRYKGVYRYSYKNWEKALKEEAEGRNGTCPIVRDENGNVVYMADGTPKPMVFNYNQETGTSTYTFKGGDAIYEDINHDGTINELDIVYLGNSNPKAQGGFGVTFAYKRFTLKANFTYRLGVDAANMARMDLENMYSNNNQSTAVNWRWRKEGDITEIPRALKNTGYNFLGSDRFIEDASYVRFSYLQMSYSFEPKWLKKYGFRSLSLYASADNLCVWTKYTGLDPEIAVDGDGRAMDGAKTPRSRSYTLSLSVGF